MPALVGTEMMLDAEGIVVTKPVAHLKLAPQFLVALVRGHAWLAPDMREMGELHSAFSKAFKPFKRARVVSIFPTVEEAVMDDKIRSELEAAVYRRLVEHLRSRTDVQNIDMMNLAGFCRNCLSNGMKEAADAKGVPMSKDQSREIVYGEPFEQWKAKHQKEASKEQ